MPYEDHEIGRDIVARYCKGTAASEKHFSAANAYLPGGDTRPDLIVPSFVEEAFHKTSNKQLREIVWKLKMRAKIKRRNMT